MRVDLLLVPIPLSLSSSPYTIISLRTVFLLSPLIPLRGLFLLRTSAIQASLIALGLASVLISPHGLSHFSFLISHFPSCFPKPFSNK